MPIDIYSTRAQLAAIDQMPREYTFLHDMFCRDAGTVEDDKAIYDFRKGNRKMAPVVHPGVGGVLMEREGYETREIGFCQVAPERVIEVEQLKGRAFNEKILGAMTPQEREKKMLARDIVDMRKAIPSDNVCGNCIIVYLNPPVIKNILKHREQLRINFFSCHGSILLYDNHMILFLVAIQLHQPFGIPISIFRNLFKSLRAIKFFYHPIFSCRIVMTSDGFQPSGSSL